ncbi:peptidoglycan-binding domain-containing protein [Rhodovulum marinum]|uniref:TPR repeat protein n=1 Tax=Rhodovulum marinum TaxID=320662 RepID=A0A4R2Q0H3_9RHOB|nr:peptidoglycan-binding domain-containing protein [Rhodovulum marinum]TCP40021.1 TPR repeat protein [Rhodovulum marinum]
MHRFPLVLSLCLLAVGLALPVAGQDRPDIAALQKGLFSEEPATREAAESQLRELADAGNAEAAGILSRDYYKRGDQKAAMGILGAAAAAGDIPSIQRLTWLLRQAGADEAEIVAALRMGWEAGDVVSGISYARGLLRVGGPDNTRDAREVFEAASVMPGFTAWSDLAKMRKTGAGGAVDPEGAFVATRKSAEAGNFWSALHLARMLLNGEGTAPDPAAALGYFKTAMEGEAEAAATARRDLAAAHLYRKFGPLSDPDAGLDLAAEGVAEGDLRMVRIAVTMPDQAGAARRKAERLRKTALEIAREAAAGGDETAARSLFDYWHRLAIRSPDAARREAEIVEAYGGLLDRPRLVRHELLKAAPQLWGQAARAEAVATLETLEGKDYTAALLDLRQYRALYIQALQSRLAEAGFDPGTVDGLFGPRTRRAIEVFCKAYDVEPECRHGPLSWQLGKVVGNLLGPGADPAKP